MFEPNIPLIIMRHTELTYQQKAFLLWCWICRDNNDQCGLISCRQDCGLRERSIQWYSDLFGIPRPHMSRMFTELKDKRIIKTEKVGTKNEVTFVDFSVFR